MISIGQGRKIERDDKMMEKMKIVVNIMTKKVLRQGLEMVEGTKEHLTQHIYIFIIVIIIV
jgi:hypothetical protein